MVNATENPTTLKSHNHFTILKTIILSSWYVSINVFARSTENEAFLRFQNTPIDLEILYVIIELHYSRHYRAFARGKRVSQTLFAIIPVNQTI